MAEWSYAHGYYLKSAYYYPLSYVFRSTEALRIGINDNKYLYVALSYDPYSPELLALAVAINLDNVEIAQQYYDRFKLVAKKSYLIEYIEQSK